MFHFLLFVLLFLPLFVVICIKCYQNTNYYFSRQNDKL